MEPVLLPAVAHRLADRPAEDLDRSSAAEDGPGPERLDQRDDLDHDRPHAARRAATPPAPAAPVA